MADLDWKALWKEAEHNARVNQGQQDEGRWLSFWDSEAPAYLERVKKEEAVYIGIVEYLRREKVFREGDRVLDIASGPGTYTLQFAPLAESVTALDISGGMLAALREEADARRLRNIRTVQSGWEQYTEPDRYEVVFTAMSPAIDGPEALLRMEACSTRSCCYITTGSEQQARARNDLWKILDGDGRRQKAFDVSYPFNLLLSLGRKPNVRFFDYEAGEKMSAEQLTGYHVKFFSKFMEMDAEKKRKIAEYVGSLPQDGWNRKSLVALFWDVA